jgi:hypothetical protein
MMEAKQLRFAPGDHRDVNCVHFVLSAVRATDK